jgi:predicted PurR-regulated permease PerM
VKLARANQGTFPRGTSNASPDTHTRGEGCPVAWPLLRRFGCTNVIADQPNLIGRLPLPPSGSGVPVTQSIVVGVAIVAALHFGREVFVPLALAVLLSFALGPFAQALRRCYFGRVGSVIASVLLAVLIIFGVSAVIGAQLTSLGGNLPRYQHNIAEKIASIKHATAGADLVQRAATMLNTLRDEITRTTPGSVAPSVEAPAPTRPGPTLPGAATPAEPARPQPLPVEIFQPEPEPFEIIQNIAAPLIQPLSTSVVVIVFVVLFLLKREDLRDRFIRLAGARDLRRTTEALDDATHRLSRYLLVQSAINACFGIFIACGLWAIGVPNPVLWGVLAMLLRFVPYIGPIIAAAFPAALSIAVDPGWSMLAWTLALFFITEPIIGQIIEPWLYGHNTGISVAAIVVAAVFWTWLWGLVGLLLSTPLTVCLVVLGRHVEPLRFLDILLGDRPALAPEESFYQRILADDPDEAADQAEQILKTNRLATYYDEVAIKGLYLAQLDVNRGGLDHERRVQIKQAIYEVIDDLSDHDDVEPEAAKATGAAANDQPAAATPQIPAAWRENAVLCVAGRGSIDEASAAMLAQLLNKHGIGARVVPSPAASAANIFQLDVKGVQLAVLCFMEMGGLSNARFLVRRLRRRVRDARIVLGFWTMTDDEAKQREAVAATGADDLVTSLRQALELIARTARSKPAEMPETMTSGAAMVDAMRAATAPNIIALKGDNAPA